MSKYSSSGMITDYTIEIKATDWRAIQLGLNLGNSLLNSSGISASWLFKPYFPSSCGTVHVDWAVAIFPATSLALAVNV